MMSLASTTTIQMHRYLGAHPTSADSTRFCVWSPTSETVHLHLVDQQRIELLEKNADGFHQGEFQGVGPGDRYFYRFDDSPDRPDPASRYQRDGVHGPSVVVDSKFAWTDRGWSGVRREDLVIYELHIGTFTEAGTFAAAIERLDELVELGITAIEMMPVADAAGRWNWGYDGVCLYAPNHNYGTPDDLRRLVDAAHAKGLAVFLDVVYNHLGPEGNYLGESGPYLSKYHTTVWGSAPNFDDPEHAPGLRGFFIANAIHWYDEYHIDGLRIDAIHCMRDNHDPHIVVEMSEAVKAYAAESGRPAMLIAESNVYDENLLQPLPHGGGFDAEWCDDFLHSMFAVLRPGEQLCHRSYLPHSDLDQTLRMGYVYEGTLYRQRGRRDLEPRVDTRGLVYSIQHHDFIGNHPLGKRLHQLTSLETQRAAVTLLLLMPAIPMLFMGEEFACERPFQFFVDFGDEALRQGVVEGRRLEYPQHDWSRGTLPIDAAAFEESKIGPASAGNAELRKWYQSLIALRKQWRREGILEDSQLTVHTEAERGLYVLQYHNPDHIATVATRLVSNPANQDPIELEVSGQVLLDSRPDASGPSQLLPNHAKVFWHG